MYKIVITKYELRSEEEIKEIKDSRKYGRDFPYDDSGLADENKAIRALEVTLTDEEFKQVKKGVLEVI